ncbi:MAG: hypothetical protein J6D37_07380 [Clostridia bacterium]|nr:hypothetical protein [Clostridia bacterium]
MDKKRLIAALAATTMLTASLALMTGCNTQTAEVTEVYQSQTRLKYFTVAEDRDFYICETYTVELYSDGTYVCAINMTEAQQKLANFEYGDVNIIKPLAVTTFTRFGTYELSKDESVGTFSLTLNEADRLTFATNAGGGHYPVVPTNAVMFVDSNDADAAAAFETEWYGKWADLQALVGAKVTLTGDSTTHMFDAGCMVFDYKSPMFKTLLGIEVY